MSLTYARLKALGLASAATLCLVAVGCSGGGEKAEPAASGTSTTEPAATGAAPAGEKVAFAQVATIFNASCMPCHNAQNKKGGVDLTTYEGAKAEVVPGDPAKSEIIAYVKGDKTPRMPFNKPPLSEADMKTLTDWVQGGATN